MEHESNGRASWIAIFWLENTVEVTIYLRTRRRTTHFQSARWVRLERWWKMEFCGIKITGYRGRPVKILRLDGNNACGALPMICGSSGGRKLNDAIWWAVNSPARCTWPDGGRRWLNQEGPMGLQDKREKGKKKKKRGGREKWKRGESDWEG